ncbi:MAG: DEAD/DEAH box helicase [Candidatus Thermoplasmatota archaeon]|nr:DEAD/DEAH box helicase [Candidatus Thermoplasmatota archaeon]
MNNDDQRFEDMSLDSKTLDALNEIDFEKPTDVQKESIAPAVEGNDMIVQARTGSGKTHSFLIPIFEKMNGDDGVEAIVLTPTRELAQQVEKEAGKIGEHHDIETLAIYGGASIDYQINHLPRTSFVAGTPGRVMDLMRRGELKLDDIDFFVLDEADRMLEMGFLEDIKWIMSRTPGEKQIMLYSATMPKEIVKLANQYMEEPVELKLSEDEISAKGVEQYYISVGRKNKLSVLSSLLDNEPGKYLIFCNTRKYTRILSDRLRNHGYKAHSMHGDMGQSARTKTMNKFKSSEIDILVSTDVASRGIDVDNITHVVNYDIPKYEKDYVHRIGRTGRLGKEGKAVTLVSRDEMEFLDRIEDFVESELDLHDIEEGGRVEHEVDYEHHSDLFGMVNFRFSIDDDSPSRWDIEKKLENHGIKHDEAEVNNLQENGGEIKIVKSKAEKIPKMDYFDDVELIEREARRE